MDNVSGAQLPGTIDSTDTPNDPYTFYASLAWGAIPSAADSSLTNAAFTSSNPVFPPPNYSTENSLSEALNETAIYSNSPKSPGTDTYNIATRLESVPDIQESESTESLTMSRAFQDTPDDPNRPAPDIIFISSDAVVFYVDEESLLKTSNNSFGGLLPIVTQSKIERVRHLSDIHSSELNVILHILYNTSCARYNPSLGVIISTIDRLPKYGIVPSAWITKSNHIYDVILPHVPIHPLEIYCLCGRHNIYGLATVVSSHLLSIGLDSLTDEDAEGMGSVYLARLFRLHRSRVQALVGSLMPPPVLHDPTNRCGFQDQKILSGAWAMATAYMSWSAKPDMSTSTIRKILDSMTQHVTCEKCLKGRDEKVNKIIVNWTLTKNTI